jgi:predicted secreted protein
MKIRIDHEGLPLTGPLLAFAVGTLVIGFEYSEVSAFVPYWASIFMLITCLFVILGFDNQMTDEEAEAEAEANASEEISKSRIYIAILWISAFVFISYFIGLILGSAVYAFCSMYLFGDKKLLPTLLISVLLGCSLFGMFEYVLEKELYMGIFGEMLLEDY